jgi:hypothetical protein
LEVVAEDEGRDEDQELHHCDAGEGTDVSECCERMPGTVDVLPPDTRPAEIYNISLVALAASRINAELTWDQRRRLQRRVHESSSPETSTGRLTVQGLLQLLSSFLQPSLRSVRHRVSPHALEVVDRVAGDGEDGLLVSSSVREGYTEGTGTYSGGEDFATYFSVLCHDTSCGEMSFSPSGRGEDREEDSRSPIPLVE